MFMRCATAVKSAIGASNIVARQNTNDQEGCRRRDTATTQSSRGKCFFFVAISFISVFAPLDFSRRNVIDKASARSVNLMTMMMLLIRTKSRFAQILCAHLKMKHVFRSFSHFQIKPFQDLDQTAAFLHPSDCNKRNIQAAAWHVDRRTDRCRH